MSVGSDTNQTNTIIPWDFSSSELFCFGGLVTKLCPTFVTPWTIACWSFHPWNSPSKNTRVGCHFLLQGIFLTQELNLGLLQGRQILYQLSYKGSFGNPQTGWHRLGLPSCQAPLCMRDMHLWWKLTRPTAERSRKQERASHWSDAVILDPWTVSSSDQPHHCLPRLHKPVQLPSYLNYSGLNFCLLKPAVMNNTPRPFWSTWNRIAQSYTFLSNLDLFLPNLDLFICKS